MLSEISQHESQVYELEDTWKQILKPDCSLDLLETIDFKKASAELDEAFATLTRFETTIDIAKASNI